MGVTGEESGGEWSGAAPKSETVRRGTPPVVGEFRMSWGDTFPSRVFSQSDPRTPVYEWMVGGDVGYRGLRNFPVLTQCPKWTLGPDRSLGLLEHWTHLPTVCPFVLCTRTLLQ